MSGLSLEVVRHHLQRGDAADSSAGKGRALEDLLCYMFETIPGVQVQFRNITDEAGTQEIDIALWNEERRRGLFGFSSIILIECKNWSEPLSSEQVSWFDRKLKDRGRDFGVLVAANGITGDFEQRRSAHQIIFDALKEHREILVMTREHIETLTDTPDLIVWLKQKRCELAVRRTTFP